MLNIVYQSSPQKLAELASEQLNKSLAKYTSEPILLLLSGGSALNILYNIKTELLDNRITITMLDDRFNANPEINNFAKFTQTPFYRQAIQQNCRIISTLPGADEVIGAMSHYFESQLKNWLESNPTGKVIATMGIGEDGHTAGVMPYPGDLTHFNHMFMRKNKLVVGYNINKPGEQYRHNLRITTSLSFIQEYVDIAIVFTIGINKRFPLIRVTEKDQLARTPAAIINEIPESFLFTDQDIHNENKEARIKN